ncbi:MAG: flagellar hook-length control protein FliK [Atribacterota bacterium]
MEGLFVFPGLVEAGQNRSGVSFSQEGQVSLKSGDVSIDFDQLLKDSVKRVEKGLWDIPIYPARSCGSKNGTQDVEPCSFSSAPVATGLSCSSNCSSVSLANCSSLESLAPNFDLSSVREGIGQFLENLEAINLSLNLGAKGMVQIQGARDENGEFTFQIQGSKDALTELFTVFFGYLATMVQSKDEVQHASQDCSFSCNPNAKLSCDENGNFSSVSIVFPYNFSVGTTVEEGENGEEIEHGGVVENNVETESNVETETLPPVITTKEGEVNIRLEDGALFDITQAEVPADETQEMNVDSLVMASGNEETVRDKTETKEKSSDTTKGFTSLGDGMNASKVNKVSPESETIAVSNFTDATQVEKIFDQILRFASRGSGSKEVVIKLQPESLGSIVVHLKEDTNRLQCIWEIADTRTRELVQRSLPLLEARLQGQGFTFENFWGGGNQEQFNWQRSSAWVLGGVSDVMRETTEEDASMVTADYRVNFLA